MTEQYPLLKEGYQAWIVQKFPRQGIGQCQSAFHNTIAWYLHDTYGVNFVIGGMETDHPYYQVMNSENGRFTTPHGEQFPLPDWAKEEVMLCYAIGPFGKMITRSMYEEYVQKKEE